MFKVGYIYYGFYLKAIRNLTEVNSISYEFEHKKSKAKLIYLQNKDKNKVFSITFRTPPSDHTGIAHVLEHCVLRGSEKYPVNNPCVEIMKGSATSFFNAFTCEDKTMYVAASINDQDFKNMIDVYMDAVFNPVFYSSLHILEEEGWHVELNIDKDNIIYNGIVLNEMRSVFSNQGKILSRKSSSSLFPDTAYGYESGGTPEHIIDITQDKLIEYHRKYYQPSNSYIYLYGQMDIIEKLKYLNDEYLDHYSYQPIDSSINIQKYFDNPIEVTEFYPVSEQEKENHKTFFSLNFVVGKIIDPELYISLEILKYILLDSNASPLKKALVNAKLAKGIYGSIQKHKFQPVFSIVAENTDITHKDEFVKTVFDALSDVILNGIDKKLVEAVLNLKEFGIRETSSEQYPVGYDYNLKIMDSWLYNSNPTMHLEYETILSKIRTSVTDNYFEQLIEKFLIHNNHRSLVILQPKSNLELEKRSTTKEDMRNLNIEFSGKTNRKVMTTKNTLNQPLVSDTTNSPVANISSDMNDAIITHSDIETIEDEESSVKILYHPEFTNRIAYVNLYFNVKVIDEELILYLSLLCNVLGKTDTRKYNSYELSYEIVSQTGGISCSIRPFNKKNIDNEMCPLLLIQSKVLVNKLPELFDILNEVVNNSIFENSSMLFQIIKNIRMNIEASIDRNGADLVSNRVTSYFSNRGSYMDQLGGLSFYKFICNMERNFQSSVETIKINLIKVYNLVFRKFNLVASATLALEDYSDFRRCFKDFCSNLNNEIPSYKEYNMPFTIRNEGLKTSKTIQYIAKGYNLKKLGYIYDGGLQVLKEILCYDYLWNMCRVKGGAYGSDINITRLGNIYLTTIMDPHLKTTLQTFDNIPNYLKDLNINKEEFNRYITKAISNTIPPSAPYLKGFQADCNYFQGISLEFLQQEQDQIRSVTIKDIRIFKQLMFDVMAKNYYCVLGNDKKIEDNNELFNDIYYLYE